MSSIEEGNLFQKVKLFESAVKHAWVSWGNKDMVSIQQASTGCPLSEGNYALRELVDKKTLDEMKLYLQQVALETSNIYFSLQFEGKRFYVECSSLLSNGEVLSLWVLIPEKDNSVFYLQNAAHDFRSPLGSIMGVVNLLQHSLQSEEGLDREEVSTLLDMIKINTDKTLNLADEIMELAEIESDSYELEMSSINVKNFLQHYIDTHRLLTIKKRIKVHFDSDLDANAFINEPKLTRALDNVLSNAVKFSDVGSNIKFQLTEEDGHVVIEIVDEGIGMNEEILRNVFTRFGRAKRSGLQGEPSHGLGMSIVRQIMKLHQGNVKISSEEGVGTKVRLILKKEL